MTDSIPPGIFRMLSFSNPPNSGRGMVIRMKSFRSYPIESTEDLPVVVGRSRGIHPGSIILHNHPGIEVNLIAEGRTQYIIGGRNHQCGPGDIVIIGEGEVHRAWDADDAVFLVIIFRSELLAPPGSGGYDQKFLAPYWAVSSGANHVVKPAAPHYADLAREILALEREAVERSNSYRLMLKAHLLAFSAILTRAYGIDDDSPLVEGGMKGRKFAALREFLEVNYGLKGKWFPASNTEASAFSLGLQLYGVRGFRTDANTSLAAYSDFRMLLFGYYSFD